MTGVMEFGLLGPLVVRSDGSEVPVRRGHPRALLAVLLLEANHIVSAEAITEALWAPAPPVSAAVAVRSYIRELRQALGQAGRHRIGTRPRGYLISVAEGELDVARFERLLASARTAARDGRWSEAAGRAGEALSCWRGEPLADIESDLLASREVPRLAELRLQAMETRIDAQLRLAGHGEVVAELQRLSAAHPLREHVHALLMLALYRCGRQAEALAAYQQVRAVLVEELGAEPGSELRALHQQILAADPALAAPATRTEAAGARPGAAAGPAPAVPRQLPATTGCFTGRAGELAALTRMLGRAGSGAAGTLVISAIGGTAGVGKTALAIHWAHQVAQRYPDGQLYVNLRGFDAVGTPAAPTEAIRGFLDALGVPPERVPASLDAQAGLYRSLLAGKQLLIVADNARDEQQVRPLLPASPGCLVVVTSRRLVAGLAAADGARLFTLEVPAAAQARQMLTARLDSARSAAEPDAVTHIANLCGCLPLALAIAAARAAARPALPLAALAAELRDAASRIDALDAGDPVASVRAVFSWSYQQLSPAAALMFRMLAEHPGPDISLAAAASLTGLPSARAREALTELAGSHLITEHLHGRFAFHDLLRLYAAQILDAQESTATRRAAGQRMLDHYLHTARAAAAAITPTRNLLDLEPAARGVAAEDFTDAGQAVAWLKAEHQVLMQAIAYAASHDFDAEAWQLPWALTDFLHRGGNWSDFALSQRTALAAAQRLGDVVAQAYAHRYIGRACFQLQDFDGALDHLTRALELRRELGQAADEGSARLDLSLVYEQRGENDRALRSARRALSLYRSAGHRIGEAHALDSVGWYLAVQRDYPGALRHCRQSLELCQELGYKNAEGHAWHSLGFIHLQLGQPAQAISCHEQAIDIYRQLMDRYYESKALTGLGNARLDTGNLAGARQAWHDALAILDDLGHADARQLRERIAGADAAASRSGP
jgi:DNA-binding SARP family transcriptional activator/tetratricopeptide (TPR) repeat protein